MRKLVVLGLVVAGAAVGTAATFHPARAGCHGEYLYDYYCASPAYRFALAPWGYRTAPQAYDAAGWSWRGWGTRGRGWSDRRVGWRRR
jgi:hypothetical protein